MKYEVEPRGSISCIILAELRNHQEGRLLPKIVLAITKERKNDFPGIPCRNGMGRNFADLVVHIVELDGYPQMGQHSRMFWANE